MPHWTGLMSNEALTTCNWCNFSIYTY